jgi:hypothetical protein
MRPSSSATFVLAVALVFAARRLTAQLPATAAPRAFAGCYELTLGPWTGSLGVDAASYAVPPYVQLDTLPAARIGWQLRPDIAFPNGNRFPGTPRWTVKGDSVQLLWSNGYTPTVISLVRDVDGTLRGQALALTDSHVEGEPPRPQALVTARRMTCLSGRVR